LAGNAILHHQMKIFMKIFPEPKINSLFRGNHLVEQQNVRFRW
jgi:hypothetical protein